MIQFQSPAIILNGKDRMSQGMLRTLLREATEGLELDRFKDRTLLPGLRDLLLRPNICNEAKKWNCRILRRKPNELRLSILFITVKLK